MSSVFVNRSAELRAFGKLSRAVEGVAVKTPALPAQAIVPDKDTWIDASVGFSLDSDE